MTNFDDDDFDFDDEEVFKIKRVSQMTEGEKLQRFKEYFDSSSRALLQQCLFRIIDNADGKGTLEILCPNQVIRQRLYRKKGKINNSITGCWSHVRWFSLCIEQDGNLCCDKYTLDGYLA